MAKRSTLTADASKTAIVPFWSKIITPSFSFYRKLSSSKQGYLKTKKEALAIVWVTKWLHKYLYETQFNIVTDHKGLKSTGNANSLSMLTRWA